MEFTETSAPVAFKFVARVSDGVKVRVDATALRPRTENRICFSEYALKIAPTRIIRL